MVQKGEVFAPATNKVLPSLAMLYVQVGIDIPPFVKARLDRDQAIDMFDLQTCKHAVGVAIVSTAM